jgi:2-amino-4-hydroxy-6-hydroxymethyldihydropteridine diphosphokinase
MINRCAIGLGSNLGDSLAILQGAIDRLKSHPQIELIAKSSWYETLPIGPPQPNYLNACATISTSLAPLELLALLLEIERQFGRERREKWGARTLDLDLLLYADLTIDLPTLQVPHPYLQERAFVLVPLGEIAADWIDPRSGCAIAALRDRLDIAAVKLLAS